MTKRIDANIDIKVARTHINQPDTDGPVTTDNNTFGYLKRLTYGTGDDQITSAFHDIRTITASTTDVLDLAGALRDGFGELITFTAIKLIGIHHLTTSATSGLLLGGGSAPLINWVAASGDQPRVRQGGLFLWVSPKSGAAVTGGTADRLTITNEFAGSINYEILILGTT